jgi:hypothetical protein
VICAGCRGDLGRLERVGRRDTCTHCGADLHSCRNCGFYEPSLANACREPQAERVLDKLRSNFCEFFVPATRPAPPHAAAATGNARDELERLFRRR